LKYYKRKSEVIYPGFDVIYWQKIKNVILSEAKNLAKRKLRLLDPSVTSFPQDDKRERDKNYFLIVSRLELYKKIELVVEVFNKLNKPLIVVGEGTEEKKLKQIAGKNIAFLSKLSDVELGNLYSNAQALIMPQEEDFGYASLEAQFFGCPVIAYKKGGARETVIEGETGIFFDNQNQKNLREAIERFNKIKYNLKIKTVRFGLDNVKRFEKEIFIKSFLMSLREALATKQSQ